MPLCHHTSVPASTPGTKAEMSFIFDKMKWIRKIALFFLDKRRFDKRLPSGFSFCPVSKPAQRNEQG